MIADSVRRTGRAVVAHEAVRTGGFGAELAAELQSAAFDYLDAPVQRVGAPFMPVPLSPPLEDGYRPQSDDDLRRRAPRGALGRCGGTDSGQRGRRGEPNERRAVRQARARARAPGRIRTGPAARSAPRRASARARRGARRRSRGWPAPAARARGPGLGARALPALDRVDQSVVMAVAMTRMSRDAGSSAWARRARWRRRTAATRSPRANAPAAGCAPSSAAEHERPR